MIIGILSNSLMRGDAAGWHASSQSIPFNNFASFLWFRIGTRMTRYEMQLRRNLVLGPVDLHSVMPRKVELVNYVCS